MQNCGDDVARVNSVAKRDVHGPNICGPLSRDAPEVRGLASCSTIAVIISVVLGMTPAFGQESPKPSDQTKPPEAGKAPDGTKQQGNPSVVSQAENAALKRPVQLFSLLEKKSIVFPDIASSTVALSPGEKFELAVDNSISVHTIAWAALGSAFGQSADSPTGFNQGWDGYGKRVGSSMARQSSAQFLGSFVIASALHEDPRFFPEYNPTFGHAIKYSLKRLFVTRNDAGLDVVNKQGLLGPLLAEGLANAYWPDRNRTAGDTLFRYGVDLAVRAGGNMFREYWPVLFAKVSHAAPAHGGAH